MIGPVIGGYLAQSAGPKYVFIFIAGLCGIASLLGIPFLRETYGPVIRMRLARKSSDSEHTSQLRPASDQQSHMTMQYLWLNMSRPIILLTRSLICFILSLYMAL